MSDVWTPPQSQLLNPNPLATEDAIEMRRRHLGHEVSLRSVGTLYYLGAVLIMLVEAAIFFSGEIGLSEMIFISAFLVAIAALQVWVGRGLRGLKSWARIPAGVMSAIGLLGFPVGTLINAYVLYLLFSAKGATVFSEEYQEVVAQTPDMKYRTPMIAWAFLGLIVLLILFAVLA